MAIANGGCAIPNRYSLLAFANLLLHQRIERLGKALERQRDRHVLVAGVLVEDLAGLGGSGAKLLLQVVLELDLDDASGRNAAAERHRDARVLGVCRDLERRRERYVYRQLHEQLRLLSLRGQRDYHARDRGGLA